AATSKALGDKDWTTTLYPLEDYQKGQNVGVKLGTPLAEHKYLADVDFDWIEAQTLIRAALPTFFTRSAFQVTRESKWISHIFYTVPKPFATKKYEDLDGQALVELRCATSDGTVAFQTMIPPSIHPSGEQIQFQSQGAIAHDDHLDRHVLLYAITCLFAKHLGPRDLNHEVRLAFAGFLFNEGFTPEEVIPMAELV